LGQNSPNLVTLAAIDEKESLLREKQTKKYFIVLIDYIK
jgi:hypothetical protein